MRGFWTLCDPDKAGLGHGSLAPATALLSQPEKGEPVPQSSGTVLAPRHDVPRGYCWGGSGGGLETRE